MARAKKLFYENVFYEHRFATTDISDREALRTLAEKMRDDFAATGVLRFAVAYLGSKITKMDRIDLPTEETQLTTATGVVIEEHDNNGLHLRAFRELIERPGAKPMLAAMTLPEAIDEGIYLNVLPSPQAMAAE